MKSLHDIAIHNTGASQLPTVHITSLRGVPVYQLDGISEPVLHLELIFNAGRVHTIRPMVPVATATMLSEGTHTRSSRQIAEDIEYFGSTLRANAGTDALSISLYSMGKYFRQSIGILRDVLLNSVFPERELAHYKQNRLHKLELAEKKNEYIANIAFNKELYGTHPYGYHATRGDISSLERDALLRHYELLNKDNLTVFLAGKVEEDHYKAVQELIDSLGSGKRSKACPAPNRQTASDIVIDGPQHLQSAIRIGRQVITRGHDDYPGLYFMNVLFGGYFGSRLMRNIREEKGLTYGVSSGLETLGKSACLVINTETSTDNRQVVIEEIRREIDRLQTDLVEEPEIMMVRNYLRGHIMMQLDGAFRAMDVVKTLVMESGELSWFDGFMHSVMSVDSEQIRQLARRYLAWDEMHRVTVV